jgi:hypothetical protein
LLGLKPGQNLLHTSSLHKRDTQRLTGHERGKLGGKRHRLRTVNWQEGKFVDKGQRCPISGNRPRFGFLTWDEESSMTQDSGSAVPFAWFEGWFVPLKIAQTVVAVRRPRQRQIASQAAL